MLTTGTRNCSDGKNALDITRKLQCLDMALGMNTSQLVDRVFKVYHAPETMTLPLFS